MPAMTVAMTVANPPAATVASLASFICVRSLLSGQNGMRKSRTVIAEIALTEPLTADMAAAKIPAMIKPTIPLGSSVPTK